MSAPLPRPRVPATAALLVVTAIWGMTFLWGRDAMLTAERTASAAGLAPDALVGLASAAFVTARFGLAWVALLAVSRLPQGAWLWPPSERGAVRGGALVGFSLLAGFLLQMAVLATLEPAVTAFLTSLYVVFTALLTALYLRRFPRWITVAGVVLATLGAGFIDGPPQVSFGLDEWLTVLSALIFGGTILGTDVFTRRFEPLVFTRMGFATVAVGGGLWTALLVARATAAEREALVQLFTDWQFLWPLLACAWIATTLALTMINLFQRHVDPVRAAILFALEPVWTAVWVFAFEGHAPGIWLLVGGGALLLGNLVAELGAPAPAAPAPAGSASSDSAPAATVAGDQSSR